MQYVPMIDTATPPPPMFHSTQSNVLGYNTTIQKFMGNDFLSLYLTQSSATSEIW